MKIKMLHLYPDLMNLYGEYGNVRLMERHLKDQGYEVKLETKTKGENIKFDSYDFIYMGCGTERNQEVILRDLEKYKEDIKKYIAAKKVFLATGNSYEIFGEEIVTDKGDIEGLNIFKFKTIQTENRGVSDVIMTSKYLKNPVVGFINKMTNISNNSHKLFDVDFGIGEDVENKIDGIKQNNFYETHVVGPILARNPELLELLVKTVCSNIDLDFKLKKVNYTNDQKGYELVLSELTKRKESEKK